MPFARAARRGSNLAADRPSARRCGGIWRTRPALGLATGGRRYGAVAAADWSSDSDGDIAQAFVTSAGTLGVRGALAAAPDTDTGYACMKLPDQDAIAVTAAPSAFANVGGYRFAMRDLQHAIGMIDEDSLIAALPHSLTGHRLAGHAADPVALRARLRDFGVNPLVRAPFATNRRDPEQFSCRR